MNQVFDVLEATKKFNGSVVFLEEDHLLAPDALHLLKLMEQQKKETEEKVPLKDQSLEKTKMFPMEWLITRYLTCSW